MGLKHPRQELTHELPRGKLAFKAQTHDGEKVPSLYKVTSCFVLLLFCRS